MYIDKQAEVLGPLPNYSWTQLQGSSDRTDIAVYSLFFSDFHLTRTEYYIFQNHILDLRNVKISPNMKATSFHKVFQSGSVFVFWWETLLICPDLLLI